ncbi:SAGA-associated factor 11 homolog isoform X2 [Folsomia candida]|uniref:SAGA-associated factor 11 homolog isoform X2 n=1 Tax=Folsomia candida TaxID=158441 RepID=UPI000B8FEE07|nr:SAGA-associated factor 11 homolog isoform X2 [Folsomia candida]
MNRDRHDRDRHSDREHRSERHRDRDRHINNEHRSPQRTVVHDREHRERERERERDRDRHHNNIINNNNNIRAGATTSSAILKSAIHEMTTLLIEEEAFFIGKETGRLMRWGELEGLGVLEDVQLEHQVVDAPGVDIFGEPLAKKFNFECECPRCRRTLAAQRFAPHLEKCMGMGRNSSRIASRRLAQGSSSQNSQNGNGSTGSGSQGHEKASSHQGNSAAGSAVSSQSHQNGDVASEEEHFEEDEDDEDWTMERKRKHTKKGTEKISPKRKGPLQRIKNSEGSRGRRGASPSVTDSPLSINESSLHDDDDFAALSLG